MSFYVLNERMEKSKVIRLQIYDFDGTLVHTTERPKGWSGSWWGNKASLLPPFKNNLNQKVAKEYFKAKEEKNTYLVMMTGRIEELKKYVLDVLEKYGINFEHTIFCDSNNTLEFKLENIRKLVNRFPDLENVEIWEDRASYLEAFDKLKEEMEKPGLSITIHRPPDWE